MQSNVLDLKGRVALITGSSRGLGRAIALRMASAGAHIVINCVRSVDQANEVAQEVRALGVEACVVTADVGQKEQAEALIAEAIAAFGRLDILVNNAGIIIDKPFAEHTDSDWSSCMDSMLNASFYVTRAALPHMLTQGYGRILAQNSIISEKFDFGGAHMSACAAAKAGIFAMLRSLAAEVAGKGITVNCVAPGVVATEMEKDLDPEVLEAACRTIPMGRFGSPEDIASAMLFLASEHASYITGQTLRVNGGMSMV